MRKTREEKDARRVRREKSKTQEEKDARRERREKRNKKSSPGKTTGHLHWSCTGNCALCSVCGHTENLGMAKRLNIVQ